MPNLGGSLDTNILLRLILGDIPSQRQKIVKQLFSRPNDKFKVSDTVLIEAMFVLERYYHLTRPEIADILTDMVQHPKLSCNSVLFRQILADYSIHTGLSVEDVYLAHLAKVENAIPLWTFDKKLSSQMPSAKLLT